MKILQLTPRTMIPADDGGRISMWNVTKHLVSRGADVTVVSLDEHERGDRIRTYDGATFRHIHLGHSTRNTALAIAGSVFASQPLYLRKHLSPAVTSSVLELCRVEHFDIVHADHTAMAPLALGVKREYSLPVGLRLHNVEWMIWHRYAESLSVLDPRRAYLRSQAERLRRAEAACIDGCDVSWTMSRVDEQRARELSSHARIMTSAAGVNTEEWAPPDTVHRRPFDLVLAASWSWIHNVRGLRWFVSRVLPLVRKQVPQVRLVLPGKGLPEEFRDGRYEGVVATGYVDDMKPSYHQSSVFVCPLFVGSGVRITIMEAMAAGLPVVATEVGAEGVEATEADGLFVSDDPVMQARHIVALITDPAACATASARARASVRSRHEWSVEIGKMFDEYRLLTSALR
ncbi:MAG: glycosyltransferase family 4 protein [Candidatus Kapaibacterium sp.]